MYRQPGDGVLAIECLHDAATGAVPGIIGTEASGSRLLDAGDKGDATLYGIPMTAVATWSRCVRRTRA